MLPKTKLFFFASNNTIHMNYINCAKTFATDCIYIYYSKLLYITRMIISFPTDLWIEDCYCGSRLNWYIRKYVSPYFFFSSQSVAPYIFSRVYIFIWPYLRPRAASRQVYIFSLSLSLSFSLCLSVSRNRVQRKKKQMEKH